MCPCAAQCVLFCTVLKNSCGQLGVAVVVDAGGVDVGDLLVEEPLAGANVANPRQQFVEVVLPERVPCLDALIVQREALYQQFAEPRRGPLPELGASLRPYTVADGQNHVEVVVLHRAPNLPGTLQLNCQVFLDSCLPILLAFL